MDLETLTTTPRSESSKCSSMDPQDFIAAKMVTPVQAVLAEEYYLIARKCCPKDPAISLAMVMTVWNVLSY